MNLDVGNCQKDVKGEACCLHTRPRAQPGHKADASVASVSQRFVESLAQTLDRENTGTQPCPLRSEEPTDRFGGGICSAVDISRLERIANPGLNHHHTWPNDCSCRGNELVANLTTWYEITLIVHIQEIDLLSNLAFALNSCYPQTLQFVLDDMKERRGLAQTRPHPCLHFLP